MWMEKQVFSGLKVYDVLERVSSLFERDPGVFS